MRYLPMFVFCGLVLGAVPGQSQTNAPAVVARVNGTEITRPQLDENVKGICAQRAARTGLAPSPEEMVGLEKEVLEQMIGEQLVVQKSASLKIEGFDAKVQQRLAEIKQRFPDEKMFTTLLESQGLTQEKLQQRLGESVRIDALLDQEVRAKIKISETESKEFYDKNPQFFSQPAQVRASHILVKVPEDADDKAKAGKRKSIDAARTRVTGGEEFAKVAAEVSDCPSKAQGGDLGFFQGGQMVKPFEEAAFALKSNEVSQVVTTQFGYHIIQQTGSKPAGVTPFAQEQDRIKEYLTEKKTRDGVLEYVASLRKAAKVEVLIK